MECTDCGHDWKEHRKSSNGAYACAHHGCGCRNVILPKPAIERSGTGYMVKFPFGDYCWQPSNDFAEAAARKWQEEQ